VDSKGEHPKERVNRELIEFLNELRVALPGVQVLFAFLLVLPFNDRFDRLDPADRRVYFAAVVATALSSAFFIAPAAHHRLRFRTADKEQLLTAGSRLAVAGSSCLAVAMAASLWLIADLLYGRAAAGWTALLVGGGTASLWFVAPFLYRSKPPDR
jgi:hypothetical protein